MNEDELFEFLRANLSIEINQRTEFGPIEEIAVTLYLGEKKISESSCSLPDMEN